jgi:hypothetical protein
MEKTIDQAAGDAIGTVEDALTSDENGQTKNEG